MNFGKLKRSLEREFKRSPGKTLVLLALLPVAGYFILPLVWKSASSRPAKLTKVPDSKGNSGTAAASFAAGATIVGAGSVVTAWHEIAAGIAADSRMACAATAGMRNPFESPVKKIAIEEQSETPPAADAENEAERRPEEYGLQLTTTIVGQQLRIATINGKQYVENATVPIPFGDEVADAVSARDRPAFVLRKIEKKHVVLENGGKLYHLQLAR